LTEQAPASPRADGYLKRLDVVQARLEEHAASPPAPGLTDPDPPTGERWEWGQVWAHLAEFVPYWCGQVRLIVQAEGTDAVPSGRVKSDPARVAAIEASRHQPPAELMSRLAGHIEELRALILDLTPADWERRGVHSTLGEMGMPAIFEDFLVGHLEGHADQLDGLRANAG
jgi:DinB family protein